MDFVQDATAIVAVFLSFLAFCMNIATLRQSFSSKKMDNLMTLQVFLHSENLSAARRYVREDNTHLTLGENKVRMVCSSFDFAGTLVRNKAVHEDLFLEYWGPTLLGLSEKLSLIADVKTGIFSIKEHYKEFWWLMDEAKIRSLKQSGHR